MFDSVYVVVKESEENFFGVMVVFIFLDGIVCVFVVGMNDEV